MTLEPHSARLLPSVVQPPTIAFHPKGEATPDDLRAMACPNCGSPAAKTLILTVDVQLPDNPPKRLRVLRCPACTANFYDSQIPPDYAEPALNNRGRVPFYVQQGAGVSLITRPLAQLRRPAGTAYMEVGCGYGFGLDFALNTRNWQGIGIDPAPLAALGRDALNLPIELRYLRDDDEARGTIDVVMGSEVIEHVTSPAAFVRTLRAMLKPGGVVILTTPNGDDIDPATPPGIIIPLLSPSLHLVIQNRHSLHTLLQQAGFAHVEVDIDSHSLVAFASDSPLDLETGTTPLRRALREHLERRAKTVAPGSDLFFAFAGRAFMESVNDGELEAADRAWAMLVPACRSRYGFALDAIEALPAAVATCGLEEMARLVPLNLGGLLYLRAIRSLAAGTPRAALTQQFLLAAEAADAMRRALGELAMEDGQTEDIGWTAGAEALLCAADAGAPDLAARYAALPAAPNGGETRRRSIALRTLSNLVNGGKYDLARTLVRDLHLAELPLGTTTEAELDAQFALAVLNAQMTADGKPLGNPDEAARRFSTVRQATPQGGSLWWAALRGEAQALGLTAETDALNALATRIAADHPGPDTAVWAVITLVNAAHFDAARTIATRSGLSATAGQPDLAFALAMLDVQIGPDGKPLGNPAAARGRFNALRLAAEPNSKIWWAALRGEGQAIGLTADTEALSALATRIDADHPGPETAAWSVTTLVNLGHYQSARGIAARAGLLSRPAAQPLTQQDCGLAFSLAMLDVQTRPDGTPIGNPAAARDRFRAVRQAAAKGSDLGWAAIRGEAQALGLTGETDALARLAGQAVSDFPRPDVGEWAVTTLVNAGQYEAAHGIALKTGLAAAPGTQPGSTQNLAAAECDLVFCLAVLDVQPHLPGRPAAEPAMARGRFARVRRGTPPGSGLWWGALRGELQALDMLDAQDEAQTLTAAIEADHPELELPPDILTRLGKA